MADLDEISFQSSLCNGHVRKSACAHKLSCNDLCLVNGALAINFHLVKKSECEQCLLNRWYHLQMNHTNPDAGASCSFFQDSSSVATQLLFPAMFFFKAKNGKADQANSMSSSSSYGWEISVGVTADLLLLQPLQLKWILQYSCKTAVFQPNCWSQINALINQDFCPACLGL